jgi:hypothetical protein
MQDHSQIREQVIDPGARHDAAKRVHEQNAVYHEQAAARWGARGDPDWGELERRAVALERALAQLAADRAELERLRAIWRERRDEHGREELARRGAEIHRRTARLKDTSARLAEDRRTLLDQRQGGGG